MRRNLSARLGCQSAEVRVVVIECLRFEQMREFAGELPQLFERRSIRVRNACKLGSVEDVSDRLFPNVPPGQPFEALNVEFWQ